MLSGMLTAENFAFQVRMSEDHLRGADLMKIKARTSTDA